MTDQGCMLRAYSRDIVDAINSCREVNTFIPALAYTFAQNPTEIEVGHEERAAGESKYSLYQLIRLNFDLVTGFSRGAAADVLAARHRWSRCCRWCFFVRDRLSPHRARAGSRRRVHAVRASPFFLIGIALFGIGLLGEYVGRIYQQVRQRPRYLIQAIWRRRGYGRMRKRHGSRKPRRSRRCLRAAAHSPLMRAVVFAYHDVGVRCLRCCSRRRRGARWS